MRLLLISLFYLCVASAYAAPPTVSVTPGDELHHDVEQGWFFYKDPAKTEAIPDINNGLPASELPADKPKPKPCLSAKTWTPACGFVDPGKDFDWQSTQRDALLQQMVMSPGDQKEVEAFQRYNKWVVDKAVEAGNTWYWNMTQHPDLDPSVSAPISSFGLNMASGIAANNSKEIMSYIAKQGGLLVYFTRDDCSYCHMMAPGVARIAADTGIPTYDATLDGKCVPGFTGEHCLSDQVSLAPAKALKVTTVPSLFLYIPDNTWIRVASGITADDEVKGRIVNFFAAWRTAIAQGMSSSVDGQPPVDFNPNHMPSLGSGVGAGVSDSTLPTQSDIKKLLFK
jgi:conjugal transfer pilus assembly protein TraF